MEWLNVAFLRMDKLLGRSAVLVEFWDPARINSLRTLPYLKAWHARYAAAGLRVIGVHSPGYSFGRDRENVERAVERLDIAYAVVLDPDFEVWRAYGNRGWPGRYLFDRRGLLAYVHFGEGDYEDTERAIRRCARDRRGLDAARADEARGRARRAAGAADGRHIAAAERERLELVRDWTTVRTGSRRRTPGAAASFVDRWRGLGGAVRRRGAGPLRNGRNGRGGLPGLRLHGMQFTPAPPAPS